MAFLKTVTPTPDNDKLASSEVSSDSWLLLGDVAKRVASSIATLPFPMSASSVIGIDPGNDGALALLSNAYKLLDVVDMPCVADGAKGRRTINAALLAAVVSRWAPTTAYVELVGPRPTDAKVAAFSFGRARGCLEGILGAFGIPVMMLTVPTWRRTVGLPASATKEMARGEAIRRWPNRAEYFSRGRDDGRAEAALIAVAGLMREGSK